MSKSFIDSVERSRLRTLELCTHTEIVSSHVGGVPTLALEEQDYRWVLSGGVDGSIALTDLEGGKGGGGRLEAVCTATEHSKALTALEWYPEDNGAFISASVDGRVLVWDASSFEVAGAFALGSKVAPLRIYHASCQAKAHGQGAAIACALSDGTIRLCDTSTGDACHVIFAHKDAVTQVRWSPSCEHHLASCSIDGTVKVFDVRKGGSDGTLLAFDWQQDHTTSASCRLPPAAAGAGAGRLYSMDWGRQQAARAHDAAVTALCFSSCGHFLISAGNDCRVRLWTADTGTLHPINYAIKPPSTRLPVQMSVAAMTRRAADDVLLVPDGPEGDIAVVPIHSHDGLPLTRLKGHVGAVTALTYRRPRQQVLSASRDGMIFLWDSRKPVAHWTGGAGAGAGGNWWSGGRRGRGRRAGEEDIVLQLNAAGPRDTRLQDAWSDDDDDGLADNEDDSKDRASGGGFGGRAERVFIPPLIRNYLAEATRARRAAAALNPPAPIAAGAAAGVGATAVTEDEVKSRSAAKTLRVKFGAAKPKRARR